MTTLKRYVVIQKETNQIVTEYHAYQKGTYSQFADENKWHEMEISDGIPINYLKATYNNGKYSITEDAAKKREYLQQQLQLKLGIVRSERNALLTQTDWTLGPDSPLSETQKSAWKKYRQQLRDITKKITAYDQQVIWPTPPL